MVRRARDEERGAAVVDFVLVLLVLLPLVIGIFQLALVLHVRNTLASAAAFSLAILIASSRCLVMRACQSPAPIIEPLMRSPSHRPSAIEPITRRLNGVSPRRRISPRVTVTVARGINSNGGMVHSFARDGQAVTKSMISSTRPSKEGSRSA